MDMMYSEPHQKRRRKLHVRRELHGDVEQARVARAKAFLARRFGIMEELTAEDMQGIYEDLDDGCKLRLFEVLRTLSELA